jgi:dTDP-L-rhamnose 4-epimerase
MNILITGGAGFIGVSLALKLLSKNFNVTVLDNLSHQIHGDDPTNSPLFIQIKDKVNFIRGDIRDTNDIENAIKHQDIIVHLASETGTGQSMYEIKRYVDVNVNGTANLLDVVANTENKVKKIVIASSRSIYGEGKYKDNNGNIFYPEIRTEEQLKKGVFDPQHNGASLKPCPTDELSMIHPISIYGITKQTQEQLVLNVCNSIGIAGVSLRFQNVYGPGQSLSNPYTGILSVFSNLILNNKTLNIFEDGLESRDFVYIDDVVEAIYQSLVNDNTNNNCYNVGTGIPTTVYEVASILQNCYNKSIPMQVSGNYRLGDIRHNFACIEKLRKDTGWEPKTNIQKGLSLFSDWVLNQELPKLDYENSINEMKLKGMFK